MRHHSCSDRLLAHFEAPQATPISGRRQCPVSRMIHQIDDHGSGEIPGQRHPGLPYVCGQEDASIVTDVQRQRGIRWNKEGMMGYVW